VLGFIWENKDIFGRIKKISEIMLVEGRGGGASHSPSWTPPASPSPGSLPGTRGVDRILFIGMKLTLSVIISELQSNNVIAFETFT